MHPAQQELERLRGYQDGWNGPRSRGANPSSFDHAERLLGAILDLGIGDARVSPTIFSVGNAALEIHGSGLKALFEVEPEGTVNANLDTPCRSIDMEFVLDATYLPESVLLALQSARAA